MDPLTQGLLGAAASQCSRVRPLGWRAAAIGGLAGILPDLDVLVRSASDPLLAVEVHRQFTHSLVFIPVGGTLAALPWLLSTENRRAFASVLAASIIGWATHGLLDACTSFGTQLLWPFSKLRVAFHVISVVDPIFTVVLLAGVVAAGWRRSPRPAAVALAVAVTYLGLGWIQRDRAAEVQQQIATLRGHDLERGQVFPTVGNQLVWRSLYRSGGRLYSDRLHVAVRGAPRFAPGFAVDAMDDGGLTSAERMSPRFLTDVGRLRWFASGWVARDTGDPSVIGDVRYSREAGSFDAVWGIRYRPGARPVTEWVDRSASRRVDPSALWREITGADPRYQPVR